MAENVEFQDWEAEETLSFCDLPIYHGDEAAAAEGWDYHSKDDGRRPSTDQELFEFLNCLTVEMCPADDIIFCGKLINFIEEEEASSTDHQPHKNITDNDRSRNLTKNSLSQRRSETLSELESSRSSVKGGMMRNSHSLNCRKLQKVGNSKKASPAPVSENDPTPLISSRRTKSKRHLFMYGLMGFPQEMELKDIRKRQSRRSPASLVPAVVGEEKVSMKSEEGKGSWSLLRAFSSKGHAGATVRAALGCIPHL